VGSEHQDADASTPSSPDPAESSRQPDPAEAVAPAGRSHHTVETLVRARLAAMIGGPRGAIEVALPIAVFTLVYVVLDELRPAVVAGVVVALVLFAVRLVQRSSTYFVRNGLVAIGFAALFASLTGRAEDAFLPGILQSAAVALALGASIVLRRPAMGYVIGAVLGDTDGWRANPAIVRLASRLTVVALLPMVVRVAVQLPLYLAGEVGWLGVSRIVLGWPLSLVAFAVGAGILARGRTPLDPASVRGG
jgi:hypothetical protein